MKKIAVLFFLLCSVTLLGQTATIQASTVYPHIKDTVNFIKFNFNGQTFGEKDTVLLVKINTKGFDKCTAIINSDTIRFFTKFRQNESYRIVQACCCAAFTLTADKNPRRGTIEFKNNDRKQLGIMLSEHIQDTIYAGKKKRIFASESAMCTFKPCEVKIVETDYFSEKYDYNEKTYHVLKEEQKRLIIYSAYFHFLHGEKIILKHDPVKNVTEFYFNGYLSDKEFQKIIQ